MEHEEEEKKVPLIHNLWDVWPGCQSCIPLKCWLIFIHALHGWRCVWAHSWSWWANINTRQQSQISSHIKQSLSFCWSFWNPRCSTNCVTDCRQHWEPPQTKDAGLSSPRCTHWVNNLSCTTHWRELSLQHAAFKISICPLLLRAVMNVEVQGPWFIGLKS